MNDNETVEQVCCEMRGREWDSPSFDAYAMQAARKFASDWADRILAAYKREIASKDAEIAKLKADVQELHDALREAVIETCHNHACCGGAPEYKCNGVDGNCFVKRWRAALAKATGEEAAK